MYAISPSLVRAVDAFAEKELALSLTVLMGRAGDALARAAAAHAAGGSVLILAGSGNNGGDGYAAALRLLDAGIRTQVVDVLGKGVSGRTAEGYYAEYTARAGAPLSLAEAAAEVPTVVIDAILGTGARLPLADTLLPAAAFLRASRAYKLAADLPLGIDAESGAVDPAAVRVDETLVLGLPKYGLYSYPAREYCGRITQADLGLGTPALLAAFTPPDCLTARGDLSALLPTRPENSHKGTFGHLLILAGSEQYRGAATLAASGALYMGAGLVTLASRPEVTHAAGLRYPELLLAAAPLNVEDTARLAAHKTAVLAGPGSTVEGLLESLGVLLAGECPLVLDADAINALAARGREGLSLLKNAKCKVILTPHPAEFARLIGKDTAEVQSNRLALARAFAAEYPVTLVLKGAGTVIAEGERFAINLGGSSALAKGGSGDVLAGALAALLAGGLAPFRAARLAVGLHALAGEHLAEELSPLGVLPSHLAAEMARLAALLYREREVGR